MTNWPFAGLEPNHYGLILADPPWRFATWSETRQTKAAPYALMTLDDLKALPVADLAAPDCALVMWAVQAMIPQAIDLMAARRGLQGQDDYLAQWNWSEDEERAGSAQEVAEAVKAELEARTLVEPQRRRGRRVSAGGFRHASRGLSNRRAENLHETKRNHGQNRGRRLPHPHRTWAGIA